MPTLKKSQPSSAANCLAMTATEGTSIMIPTLTRSHAATLERSSSKICFARRQSSMVAIMGNITCSLAPASEDARTARIWVRSTSG